jgi:hypothetical protein
VLTGHTGNFPKGGKNMKGIKLALEIMEIRKHIYGYTLAGSPYDSKPYLEAKARIDEINALAQQFQFYADLPDPVTVDSAVAFLREIQSQLVGLAPEDAQEHEGAEEIQNTIEILLGLPQKEE